MSPLVLSSTLGAMRKAGSVFGVIFVRENEVLFSDAPFTPTRVYEMVSVLDDIVYYFRNEDRETDQLSFGYDGGNLLILMDGVHRIIVLHTQSDEVDFIAKSARAFLKDYQISFFARGLSGGGSMKEARKQLKQAVSGGGQPENGTNGEAARPVTQRVSLRAEQASEGEHQIRTTPRVADTEPIKPVTPRPLKPDTVAVDDATKWNEDPISVNTGEEIPDEAEGVGYADEVSSDTERIRPPAGISRERTAPIVAAGHSESVLPPPRDEESRRS